MAGKRSKRGAAPDPPVTIEREAIARLAYELYLLRGSAHGHDVEDWLRAEQLLLQRRKSGQRRRAAGGTRRLEDKFGA